MFLSSFCVSPGDKSLFHPILSSVSPQRQWIPFPDARHDDDDGRGDRLFPCFLSFSISRARNSFPIDLNESKQDSYFTFDACRILSEKEEMEVRDGEKEEKKRMAAKRESERIP